MKITDQSEPKRSEAEPSNEGFNKGSNTAYFRPALLRTESEEDFEKLFDELQRDIEPATFVELTYVFEVAELLWDIMRRRRNKADIIDNAFRKALANLLRSILTPPGALYNSVTQQLQSTAQTLASEWFYSQESKDQALALLKEADLNIRSIETEALRLSLDDIERVDRLLTAAEARRDKALRSIAWYRESFAKKLQQSSERILAAEQVPSIVSSDLAN
jgi:hypothetical protein